MSLALIVALLAATSQTAGDSAPQKETLIVTGTWEPIPAEEVDRSVRVLSVRDMQSVVNTPLDLLRLDPSLNVQGRGPNGIQTDLGIRGSTFGQTLVLLDGLRLNDAQSGHHSMDLPVPLESLERIEVLRGSGSTLYGSDAIGGVVNFITRKPDAFQARLQGALGNFGVNQERGAFSFAGSRWSQQISASRDFSSGFMPNRDYRNLTLATTSRIRSNAGWSTVNLGYADKPFGADQFYGNYPSWENTKTWFAGARQELGSKTAASFAYRRHSDWYVLYRDQPERYQNHHATEHFQASIQRHENFGDNVRLCYGADGLRDSIDSTNLGSHRRGRGAVFTSLDVRALKRFSFTAGFREEFYGGGNRQFSPSVSAGYWISQNWKLRASASRAYRLPTYTELYYTDPANIGNPNLRPESAWGYEGGVTFQRGIWHADAAVFQRREKDGIDYVRATPADIWRAANIHQLHFTGIEASAGVKLKRNQTLDFGYTGLKGTEAALSGLQSKYVFNYPVHSGFVQWMGELPMHITGRLRVGALERLGRDPYGLLDIYLAHTAHRVQPFIQFTNLTDTRYQEIVGIVMPGRAVVGGMQLVLTRRP